MRVLNVALLCLSLLAGASAKRSLQQISAAQNYNPVTITASSAPFDIIATPITPAAPYPQNAFQCNVTGDSRFPAAGGTYPLTVRVPAGQRVRVIFANGNLGGATVTQQGEPGVIVQQGGSPIVQQAGYASPIVQPVGSPVVQQNAPPSARVVQQAPTTVVQQPSYPQATVVQQSSSTTPTSPVTQSPPASPVTQSPPASPVTQSPPASPVTQSPPAVPVTLPPTTTMPITTQPPTGATTTAVQPPTGRKLLQETVPGGPNNGQVEYVALASANTVPGFVVPNTQFGVPYVEFTASAAAAGQTAMFKGVLDVAVVVGGVPQYPFRPNPRLSPMCQVNVNFQVA